jgi:hypothetical protein
VIDSSKSAILQNIKEPIMPVIKTSLMKADDEFLAEVLALVGDFENPVFPDGTSFYEYDSRIPFALISKPDGGALCCAFDMKIPRPFPAGAIVRPGIEGADSISNEEFFQRFEQIKMKRISK